MKFIDKILDHFNKDKRYSHFFIYKWGILAGVVESLLVILATFSLMNLYEIFRDFETFSDSANTLVPIAFFYVIFFTFTFLVVFGMPLYLLFYKKMVRSALSVLLTTIATLFVFFALLFLILFF